MKHILFLIIGLTFINSVAQNSELQEENLTLLEKFKIAQTVSEKLLLISEKLNADLKYMPDSISTYCNIGGNRFEYKWEVNHWRDSKGKPCGKKILFYIFYKKGKYMLELNESHYPDRKNILGYLNEKNVDKILILEAKYSRVLFGTRGDEIESIVVYSDDKKIKKNIEQIIKKENDGYQQF